MPFQLGSLSLATNLFLAPLAGYTNLPFRLIIRELGGVGLCTTDLVNARSLLEANRKALQLIQTCPADRPLAVQLYGSVPEEMRDAALLLQERGVDVVDVNMGCPVPKICSSGAGAVLLNDPAKAVRLVRGMVEAVRIPVTCKMRLGWDDRNMTAPEMARELEQAGVAAITVHGRTRQQGFEGRVRLSGIRAVVEAVRRIPVIGNGDVTSPEAARVMFKQTGCAAVSIGRGAFYNPWIFRQTFHYLATGEMLPEPTLEERLEVMRRHLDRMVEVFGEAVGCRLFRKVALEYAKQFGPAAEFNRRVSHLSRRSEFEPLVADFLAWRRQFLDESGRLRRCFAPRSLAPDYERVEPAAAGIHVPSGPNELW